MENVGVRFFPRPGIVLQRIAVVERRSTLLVHVDHFAAGVGEVAGDDLGDHFSDGRRVERPLARQCGFR